jgi:hypothetical protein
LLQIKYTNNKSKSYSLKLLRRKFLKNLKFQKKWSSNLWKVFHRLENPFICIISSSDSLHSFCLHRLFSLSFSLFNDQRRRVVSIISCIFVAFYGPHSWVLIVFFVSHQFQTLDGQVLFIFVSSPNVYLHFSKLKK